MARFRLVVLAAALSGCMIEGPSPDDAEPASGSDGGDAVGDPWSSEPAEGEDGEEGEPGEMPPPATEEPPGEEPPGEEPPTQQNSNTVCFPGANQDYTACLPVVVKNSSFGSAYNYPSHSSSAYQAPLRFIDLSQADPSMKLAPNFVVGELMQQYKGRYGLYQVRMVEKLQALRTQTGGALHINSGYRSPGYNAGVDGATYSRHMYGDAADMYSSVVSLSSMKTRCQNLGADYVGMYTSHIHCDWRYDTPDPAFYGPAAQASYEGTPAAEPDHVAMLAIEHGAWLADATGFDEGEPYREWTAFDADGEILEVIAAAHYQPPVDAAAVEVMIGGQLTLRARTAAPEQVHVRRSATVRLDTLAAGLPTDTCLH